MNRAPRFLAAHLPPVLVLASLLLLGVGCGSSSAELEVDPTYRITGTLTSDGKPVTPASIVLERSPLGALTDENGAFDLGPLRRGSYEVRVLYLGFRSNPGDMPIPGPGSGTNVFPMYPVEGQEALADSVLPVTVTFEVVRVD